ncbi:E3 ubiquitin-protein ligase LRSAM1 [Pimephales promelas]|uniref:E3 ubiquitin-protein ligase LRSAM1 n=1 Tax=Pimephales promelas TaxID=90988 RepID=UPI001955C7B3|nr:E3 ubiquitin-protein ligase LRSAM1 [Pimephales promelas]KAG1959068.1 E3 ubiquitin-protein ligase LRSAM1 [Pimephales promelas]KAG1959069.1 E3 ubiquitin-protein ligase LRSAM1 [Pimephales promelas]
MFLFSKKKKPSVDSKKRLENQLCLAKEAGADDVLDISACELTEVPSSVFSMCKVLQKKVLILHGNDLRSLVPKGCCTGALTTLKVLDLHENKLTSLPDDIGQLLSLQVLNVEKNHIKQLPDSVGDLQHLQTLNVKGNCLTVIPVSVGRMSSLRSLDISENSIRELPKELARVRTLESLILDAQVMSYPPASVCMGGTEEVQRYLCLEMDLDYCPPSQYLLPVLEHDGRKQEVDCVDGEEIAWQSKFMDYEKRKEQKQLEKLTFEKDLEEKQREHTQLLLLNNSRKEDVLMSVKLEQERLALGVTQQQKAQDAVRLKMLDKVRQAESVIMGRISDLLFDNKRQAKSAEFLQALEMDRIRMEQLATITQEEANSLRKKEVADAMQRMLSESCSLRLLQEAREAKTQILVSETCKSLDSLDKKFDQVLSLQQLDKSKAISQILQEEEMQKAAFEALQLQKDSVHAYIRNQIKLIEAELLQLTKLEVKRRNLDAENLQEVLADQRTALSDLLQQLLKQKDQREEELKQVLMELEQKSESNQQNYWMIQYQRLLDAKPLSLRMQEEAVDRDLGNMLCKLSAQHYLPIIAHHRITVEALRHMTAKDLRKLGINEVGVQKALLHWARERTLSDPLPKTAKEIQEAGPSTPSAPPHQQLTPPLTPNTPLTPTAPGPDRFSSSECVVCMEHESHVIFLPCGHVCCCQTCSDALQSCPLCRASISQRVRLYHG